MMGRRGAERGQPDVSGLAEGLLRRGLAAGATDLHFEPTDTGLLVRVRVDGQLLDFETVPAELAPNLVARLKVLGALLTYRMDIPQEGSVRFAAGPGAEAVDLRIAAFPTIRGERVVVRVFGREQDLKGLEALGLTAAQVRMLRQAVAQPAGLIVVTGPAGAGKTTTLYALIRELRDHHPGRCVITLEDPVEQRLDGVTQIQVNPYGELSYGRCLRSLLRQDPQVLLLGEVRDGETAALAVEAALTGHLILTTLHSGGPAETIVRWLEMGVAPYQLVSTLTLVCAQRLVRRLCSECRGRKQSSCGRCLGTGYHGRVAVAQVVRLDESVREEVLRRAPAARLREVLKVQGPGLAQQGARLVSEGVTDAPEVARVLGTEPAIESTG
ncbi:MAG TPA: GspE/PulE family protein [Phycisphaerae bacterium]|nr:GspE/PulE family protein [Phycisphaerae bacterium]HNU43921.1 GspE/PulE family protein [Phycisphaerae bacterium]